MTRSRFSLIQVMGIWLYFLLCLIPANAYEGVGGNSQDSEQGQFTETFPMALPPAQMCLGGGIYNTSEIFNMDLSYNDFKLEYERCQNIQNPHERSDIYNQKRYELHNLISQYLQEPGCEDVKGIFYRFINTLEKFENHFSELDQTRMELLESGSLAKDPQTYGAFRGWTSSMCGASHLIERASVYWFLLERLEHRQATGPITLVSENGQLIEDCRNVMAWGSEDLENFYVSLQNATTGNIQLNYNTYNEPDRIKLFAGNSSLKHDSNCIGTVTLAPPIVTNVSPTTYSQIKVEVDASCMDPQAPTGWFLTLSCDGAPIADPCGNRLDGIIQALRQFLNTTGPLLEYYWMYALCFESVHHKIMPTIESQFPTSGTLTLQSVNPDFIEEKVLAKYASPDLGTNKGDIDPNSSLSAHLKPKKAGKTTKANSKLALNASSMLTKNAMANRAKVLLGKVSDPKTKTEKSLERKKSSSTGGETKKNGVEEGSHADDASVKNANDRSPFMLGDDPNQLLAQIEEMNQSINKSSPLSSHLAAKKRQLEAFGVDLENFRKKNTDFCENQWGKGDEIFQKISYTYCSVGIIRLFGKGKLFED